MNVYIPSASMIWIRFFGLSAARYSQSRNVGHPVGLSCTNILEFWGMSNRKARPPHLTPKLAYAAAPLFFQLQFTRADP